MASALPLNALPRIVHRAAAGIRGDALVDGLRAVTAQLEPRDLLGLVERDVSLYHGHLWPAERSALLKFLRQHREAAMELQVDDFLDLLEYARPDLVALLRALDHDLHGLGTAWLSRRWVELKALVQNPG